jgi:hypothetical protein
MGRTARSTLATAGWIAPASIDTTAMSLVSGIMWALNPRQDRRPA